MQPGDYSVHESPTSEMVTETPDDRKTGGSSYRESSQYSLFVRAVASTEEEKKNPSQAGGRERDVVAVILILTHYGSSYR